MGIDLSKAHALVVAEVRRPGTVDAAMERLLDWCESEHPHPDWKKLRTLPFGQLDSMVDWLGGAFQGGRPRAGLQGLWFGLFNPCPDGKTPVADLYVCGTNRFDADPNDNEWAVRPAWRPKSYIAFSEVLADIYRIAYSESGGGARKPLGNDAEYPLALAYGALAMRETLGRLDPAIVLGGADALGVAVGFDSGDFVLLGSFSSRGLAPFNGEASPSPTEL